MRRFLSIALALMLSGVLPGQAGAASSIKPVGAPELPGSVVRAPLPVQPSWVYSSLHDVDGDLFAPGALKTPVILYEKGTGQERLILTSEFDKIHGKIGRSGDWARYELRPESYRYCRSLPGQPNYFLQHVQEMVESGTLWQGPSWAAFAEALSRPPTARWAGIVTARGHSREHILEAFRYLQTRGLIQHLPSLENIYPVGKTDPMAKVEAMFKPIDSVEAVPIARGAEWIVNPEKNAMARRHLFSYSDDTWENVEAVLRTVGGRVARGFWKDVKFVIYFTGQDRRLATGGHVIQQDGTHRSLTASEAHESRLVASWVYPPDPADKDYFIPARELSYSKLSFSRAWAHVLARCRGERFLHVPLVFWDHWLAAGIAYTFFDIVTTLFVAAAMPHQIWGLRRFWTPAAAVLLGRILHDPVVLAKCAAFLGIFSALLWKRFEFCVPLLKEAWKEGGIWLKARRYLKNPSAAAWDEDLLNVVRDFANDTGYKIVWTDDPDRLAVSDRIKREIILSQGWVVKSSDLQDPRRLDHLADTLRRLR